MRYLMRHLMRHFMNYLTHDPRYKLLGLIGVLLLSSQLARAEGVPVVLPSSVLSQDLLPDDGRPKIAVYDFESKSFSSKALPSIIQNQLEVELSGLPEANLLSRSKLESIIKERNLSIKGITEPREWGNLLRADFVISGSVNILGKNLYMDIVVIDVQTGESSYLKTRTVALGSAIPQPEEIEKILKDCKKEIGKTIPRQGKLQASIGLYWIINLGRFQGMKGGDLGSLYHLGKMIGKVTIVTVDDFSSQISILPINPTFSPISNSTPQQGDRVRFSTLEALNPDQRDLWQASMNKNNNFTVKLNNSESKSLSAGDLVAVGQHLSLELTAPVPGYPIVISAFPQDENSYLLYPNISNPNPIRLEKGQHWNYPSSADAASWVALEPLGATLFKVFILPQPIKDLSFSESGQIDSKTLQVLLKAIQNTRENGYQAQINIEIIH
jgi:hypothetical protein